MTKEQGAIFLPSAMVTNGAVGYDHTSDSARLSFTVILPDIPLTVAKQIQESLSRQIKTREIRDGIEMIASKPVDVTLKVKVDSEWGFATPADDTRIVEYADCDNA